MLADPRNKYLSPSNTSPEIEQVIALAQERGWRAVVLGRAPMPQIPIRLGNWLLVPASQDQSPIPKRTLRRIQTIYTAGLRPKGFVVVHEAPRLLPVGTDNPPDTITLHSPARRQLWRSLRTLLIALGALLAVSGALALLALVAVAVAGVLAAASLGLLLGAVAVVDPILVMVTSDDTWIEIDRWWVT